MKAMPTRDLVAASTDIAWPDTRASPSAPWRMKFFTDVDGTVTVNNRVGILAHERVARYGRGLQFPRPREKYGG